MRVGCDILQQVVVVLERIDGRAEYALPILWGLES
jgi:hypothetical protein